MSAQPSVEPGNRVVIGITFGNSNSSIAYTVDDKAEVIANEDGGMYLSPLDELKHSKNEGSESTY